MSLKSRIVSGVSWSAAARYISQGVQLGVTVLLMRLLSPKAYGLLAMAMVLIGFADSFKGMGLKSALVQKQEPTQRQVSTVFYVALVFGLCLTGLFVAAAPYAARFFGEVDLAGIVRWLSPLFFLGTLGLVPRATLESRMRFDVLAKVDVSSVVASSSVAVAMAVTGWGVWSLVAKRLIQTISKNVLVWWYSAWRPSLLFSWRAAERLLRYGGNLTGFKVVNRLARTGDDLLIGKFMTAGSLGVYNRAYRLMLLPINRVIRAVRNVLFPALSSIKHDVERVRRIFLRSVRAISFVTFPMMIGLIVVADVFVLTLLGSKWKPAVPIIRILCIASLVQTLANPTGWIYRSQGRTDWMFRWGLFGSMVSIIAIIIGVCLGSVESVAWSYTIANIVLLYPVITIPGWLIEMSFVDVGQAVSGNLAVALAMAGGVYGIRILLPANWSPWTLLVLQVGIGVLMYFCLAHVFKLKAYTDFQNIGRERWETLRESWLLSQT